MTAKKNTFNDFQQAQKTLAMETWAMWESLQALSRDMLAVQWRVAQSQWEIAEAVGELNTRLWLSWKELQDFTTKYLQFASVTGQDWKQAIADNIRMFNIWWVSIDKQAEYLDKLTVAWQKTWISVSTLTNQLQSNAPVLQELWFSLEDSIALLSNFEQAWVEASQVLQSMKMWLKNLAEDWVSPMESLNNVIKWVQDWTIGLNEVMEIFWSRWWTAMYNAIKNGTFALDDMKASLNDVSGAVENTYNEMETLWEFISRKWSGLVSSFIEWNNEGFQATRKLYHMIGDELTPSVERLSNNFTAWKETIKWVVKWERELDIENWKLVYRLTEQWKVAEETRRKEEELNQVLTELWKLRENARTALDKFNNTKVDDSKTRSEFEADRKSAINAMVAFEQAYAAKMKYFDKASDGKGKSRSKRWWYLLSLSNDIKKTIASEYTWTKDSEENWGILWEEILWWSGGWWGSKSKAEDMLESFRDEFKDLYNEMDDTVSDHQKTYDNLVKEIEKVQDQYEKLKNKAKDTWESAEKSIRSYNEQLEKNQTDSIEKLGQRYVELKEKRAEIDNDYLKRRIWDISSSEWSNIRDEWWTWHGFTYNDLKDIKELYDEIKLIEENTTEEQRKSQEFTEKTSKAQEILNDMNEKAVELEQQKAQALEKQAIAQAMMNQEEWKRYIQTINKNWEEKTFYYDTVKKQWERILDEDNIQYAKQLEQQTTELNNQLEQYKSEKDEEVEILIDINARKTQLEKEYTVIFQDQVSKQKKSVEELISSWDRLIAKKNEYYSSSTISKRAYGWEISSAKVSLVWENWPEHIIARQSSYVQPRNASNSYSTVNSNNTSNLTINWMEIGTYNSTDEMLEDLKQRLTYRS